MRLLNARTLYITEWEFGLSELVLVKFRHV